MILLLQRAYELFQKMLLNAALGAVGLPIFMFLEKYIFSDWEFLIWLLVLITIDTALGFGLAVKQRKINPDKFGGLIGKLISYTAALIVGHVFANFTISGENLDVAGYLKLLIYSSVIVKESISIFRHLGALNKKWVPTWLLARLEDFDKTGDLNSLKGKPNGTE